MIHETNICFISFKFFFFHFHDLIYCKLFYFPPKRLYYV
jgi:hypothetical protein